MEKIFLSKEQLIARFEPGIHRGNEPLVIKNWWWEEKYCVTDEVIKEVISCLEGFCKFLKSSGLSDESYNKISG